MSERLGPLERVDGHWVIGDPGRENGAHLLLSSAGAEYRVSGQDAELVPWPRFVELTVEATNGAPVGSKVLSRLSMLSMKGTTGSWVRAILRHPHEDWAPRFIPHQRRHTVSEILLAGELLRQTVASGPAERLGDPDWLSHQVVRLAPLRARTPRGAREVVARVLRDC